jgi:colicin import membrane protein
VTTLQEHIEALDPEAWAALTKRTAECAVGAAQQVGRQPPAELVAVAAMTEAQLIEHRRKNSGKAKRKRPTARMKLIEADHRCSLAELRAREAEQDKEDALADAAAARARAQESAAAAEAARERAAAAYAESGWKELQLDAERRDGQAALERLREELERVRAKADAEVAAVREHANAPQERADQRMPTRAAGQQEVEELRTQLEQVRADAAAAIEAGREQAEHAMAAALQGMEERIARERAEAEQRVDEAARARARAEADVTRLRAEAEAARAGAAQLLTLPVPPWEVRPETRRIENALGTLHQIDYVLEVGMAEEVTAQIPLDAELVRNLVRAVQGQAEVLPQELGDLSAKFSTDSQVQAASSYAEAAAAACRAFLRRIDIATHQLRHRDDSADAEVIAVVMSMLADPQVQNLVLDP